jgi:hypothetical protein
MKVRLPFAIMGLAISFAAPAFAQEKDTVDPQVAEQLSVLSKKTDEAFNKGGRRRPGFALHRRSARMIPTKCPDHGRRSET